MNSRTHKIYEDLLDDVSALSTPGVDTSDSSPEWTDTDYYDLLIMIPYNLKTQHSYQDTINKCEDVEFILSTIKHIDDYSQVFAFCSNTEKTMPDSLEYPYVRPQFDAQTGCISFAIKHSFTNLRQVFKFLMNLNSLFYESDAGFTKKSQPKRTGELMNVVAKVNNQWDINDEGNTVSTNLLINPIIISKFISQLSGQEDPEYRIFDKMDEFKTICYTSEMFLPSKDVFKGFEKYYKSQFDDFVFEQLLDRFEYKAPNTDAEDIFPNSVRTFLEKHKTDKITLSALADKYSNINGKHRMTSILFNTEFPVDCVYYTNMKNWSNCSEYIKLYKHISHMCVVDSGEHLRNYDVLRIFTYLGINKTYDGVVLVLGQTSLDPTLVDEDAESFVDDIDMMFGSVMKPNEKRQMIKEIINYSEQLQKTK